MPAAWREAAAARAGRDPRRATRGRLRGLVSDVRRLGAGRRHLAGRLRRARPHATRRPASPSRSSPRYNLGRLNPLGSEQHRARTVRPRHRGAAPPLPPADGAQRRDAGARCSANPAPAPTWRRSPPGPTATATSGSSPGQKVWSTWAHRSDFGDLPGPHRPRRPQAQGHHLLPRRPASCPASTSASCATWAARSTSTRCGSTRCGCPTSTGSARPATAGGWPARRSPASARWWPAPGRVAWTASAASGVERLLDRAERPVGPTTPACGRPLMRALLPRSGSGRGPTSGCGPRVEGRWHTRCRPRRSARSTRRALNQRMQLAGHRPAWAPHGQAWAGDWLDDMPYEVRGMIRSRANTIEGGTTEINKNVIGRAGARPSPRARPVARRALAGDPTIMSFYATRRSNTSRCSATARSAGWSTTGPTCATR